MCEFMHRILRHIATGGLFFLGLLLLTSCVITEDGIEEKPLVVAEIFPPSKSVASYRPLAAPKRMDAEALAGQLGSKERHDLLRKWNVTATLTCDYHVPGQPPHVRISVTELGSKISAYGAYTNLRPGLLAEKNSMKIGIHATIDGARLFCVHDRYLIVVNSLAQLNEEQTRTLLINFARVTAGRIARPLSEPDPVGFLPYENRVIASERLDKDDPLGLSIFDKGAVTCLYRVEGREGKVFVAQVDAAINKTSYIKKFVKEMEKYGKVRDSNIADPGHRGMLFNHPCFVSQRDNAIFGVYGTLTEDEMRELMAAIDRLIKPYVPSDMKAVKRKEAEREKEKEKEKPPER